MRRQVPAVLLLQCIGRERARVNPGARRSRAKRVRRRRAWP